MLSPSSEILTFLESKISTHNFSYISVNMRMDTKKHEAGRVFEVYLSLFHGFTSSSIIFMNYAEVLKNIGNFTLADYNVYIYILFHFFTQVSYFLLYKFVIKRFYLTNIHKYCVKIFNNT